MTSDIHPHWTSTDTGSSQASNDDQNFWPMDGEVPVHHRVHVAGGGRSSLFLIFSFVLLGTSSLGVLFYHGIRSIRADLLSGTPDVISEVTENGFSPETFSIEAGKMIEWKNTGTANQQFRSDQLDGTSAPLVSSPLLPTGTSYRFRVPESLIGTMLTVRNSFVPTIVQTITIEAPVEGSELSLSSVAVSLPAMPPSMPTVPALPAIPSTSLDSARDLRPSIPSIPSIPSLPSAPSTPSPTPILRIGTTTIPPSAATWPSLLRVNYFITSPIQAAREQWQEREVHSTAGAPPARRQPETGPALWILTALTLGAMPILFRKRKA